MKLADAIILKIESFFEQACDECEGKYQHSLDDASKPRIFCFLCMQGAHSCPQITAKLDALAAVEAGDKPLGYL
jgi:hypothetical protein